MHKQFGFTGHLLFVFIQIVCNFYYSSNVAFAGEDPFTPKASVLRYWKAQIRSTIPQPPMFLLAKASPMTAVESATFSKLASQNALPSNLPSFCSKARLLCFPDLAQSLEKHSTDVNFNVYTDDKNFTSYGSRPGGTDSFTNYSNDVNIPIDTFRHYARGSAARTEGFSVYGEGGNVVNQGFNTYGVQSTGGLEDFKTYNQDVNEPNLGFTSYSTESNGVKGSFAGYTQEANAGIESFSNYAKKGNVTPLQFISYAKNSNVMASNFKNYGQSGLSGNTTFLSYADDGNVPKNDFRSYDDRGEGGILSFNSYRDHSNVGTESFRSYAKKSQSQTTSFSNYGKSFNMGSESFDNYGEGATKNKLGFSTYAAQSNSSFIGYADKKGASFSEYANLSTPNASNGKKSVNRWIESGKFFRESVLKQYSSTPMPDIIDKLPGRSFLPRSISSKLPFSTAKLPEMKTIFHAADNSSMEAIIIAALAECERIPSAGETKRCVASMEDMLDFAVSNLGRNVVVRTTESIEGSKKDVMIGSVRKVNGGQETTQSVSCHQMLYPSLLYYCHSVPTVRVYEADIHDPKTRKKINVGVAICHIDTSAWSPTHGAFLALGSKPGQIEVCHWIFENDMSWTRAD